MSAPRPAIIWRVRQDVPPVSQQVRGWIRTAAGVTLRGQPEALPKPDIVSDLEPPPLDSPFALPPMATLYFREKVLIVLRRIAEAGADLPPMQTLAVWADPAFDKNFEGTNKIVKTLAMMQKRREIKYLRGPELGAHGQYIIRLMPDGPTLRTPKAPKGIEP